MKLLVAGAQPRSLGEAIVTQAEERFHPVAKVSTAGFNGEDYPFDVRDPQEPVQLLEEYQEDHHGSLPEAIVCTVGINDSLPFNDQAISNDDWLSVFSESMFVNAMGPLMLLRSYANAIWRSRDRLTVHEKVLSVPQFVAIGSNSSSIARSNSAAYCASKAALSMGVRVAAREYANQKLLSAYVYEPGWITGTPMSMAVEERYGKDAALHRIPAGQGIDRDTLARMIVNNLTSGMDLNGCSLRIDGGEQ